MEPEYPKYLYYRNLIICIVILCLSACTQLPVKQPVEKDKVPIPEEVPEQAEEEIEDDQPKISIIEILSSEAEKFSLQGNYQDALFVYNQALAQASEDEKPSLIFRIELVLSKTPTKKIEEFIDIKNIYIPKSLLLYWLGLNYALENT